MEEKKSIRIQELKREAMKKLLEFAEEVDYLYAFYETDGNFDSYDEAYEFIEDFLMAWTEKGDNPYKRSALKKAWEKIEELSKNSPF